MTYISYAVNRMNKVLKSFGKSVRAHRTKLGLSQEELADKIGRDTRSIVAIEAGRRNTTIMTLHRLSKALGTTIEKLLSF